MARVSVGPLIADIRGATAHGTAAKPATSSTIFARNRSGIYTRAWALPNNPQTPQQQAWRANFALSANNFAYNIPATDITTWNNLGAATRLKNKLGEVHTLSGLQLFTRCQQLLQASGATNQYPDTLQTPPQDPGPLSGYADFPTETIVVNTTNPLPDNNGCIIRATPAIPLARNYIQNYLHGLWTPPATEFAYTPATGGPIPPWNTTPTYNAAHWTSATGLLTFTPTSGAEDLAAYSPNDLTSMIVTAKIPDITRIHTIASFRLQIGTGECYLIGYTPTPVASIAIYYRSTWTATPTVIATQPTTIAALTAVTWEAFANGPQLELFNPLGGALIVTDYRLRSGDFGLAPSNGPIVYTGMTAQANLEPPAIPGDITAQYLQKYGTIVEFARIGVEVRFVSWPSGVASNSRTILFDTG